MKKLKKMNNKGFSLIELIIVIAIMAILVGVLAPSLLRYVEKTNVSADTQLADAVRTAVVTAMMDPAVINAKKADGTDEGSAANFTTKHATLVAISDETTKGAFLEAVKETLGFDDATVPADGGTKLQTALVNKLKSHTVSPVIKVQVTAGNSIKVVIEGTDNTGGKTPVKGTTDIIVE